MKPWQDACMHYNCRLDNINHSCTFISQHSTVVYTLYEPLPTCLTFSRQARWQRTLSRMSCSEMLGGGWTLCGRTQGVLVGWVETSPDPSPLPDGLVVMLYPEDDKSSPLPSVSLSPWSGVFAQAAHTSAVKTSKVADRFIDWFFFDILSSQPLACRWFVSLLVDMLNKSCAQVCLFIKSFPHTLNDKHVPRPRLAKVSSAQPRPRTYRMPLPRKNPNYCTSI